MTASPMAPVRSAPATEAAGPEYSVSAGGEGLGHAQSPDAGRAQAPDGGPGRADVEAAGGVDELVDRPEGLAISEVNAGQGRALAGFADVGGGGHAEDPDGHHVPLQQGVDGLGGRVGHQVDGVGSLLGGDLADDFDDA